MHYRGKIWLTKIGKNGKLKYKTIINFLESGSEYMGNKAGKVYVVGHKNPDTDSICSAIAYAELKRKITGEEYVAKRAGQINEETHFVLEKFGVTPPALLQNVKLQVKDMDIRYIEGVEPNISIKEVWKKMHENMTKTMPVLKDGELVGLISTGDIAKSYMEIYDSRILSAAKTPFKNIIRTLDGTLITGSEEGYFSKGKVSVAASDTYMMEELIEKDDLVIIGNRRNAQSCAIDIDCSCLVICNGAKISEEVIRKAEDQNILLISTPHDTFTAARLINQSMPIKHLMSKGELCSFHMNDYVDDIKEIMTKNKFRDFPIVDRHGYFQGFISRRRLMTVSKKQVILVDHNEKSQAVDGIEEADIVEIIDHHRLGNIETVGPVFFRNQPVGCTATIITQMYEEECIPIDPTIAGLLCSAIVSDTLMFRSPTCTPLDEKIARKLAKIAEVDIEEMAMEMFNAGSSLKGKSAQEICFQDFKQFKVNDIVFGVGQINSMNTEELEEAKTMLKPHLPKVMNENRLNMVFFMLTDILNESTELICCGVGSRKCILDAYDVSEDSEKIMLRGVVSRKKQLIPALVSTLQH